MMLATNNSDVTFEYYDTPHKRYKKMSKAYISGMVQASCYAQEVPLVASELRG